MVGCKWISVERTSVLHLDVQKGVTYFILPISSGCKFKQYLFNLKLFPPPAEEVVRSAVLKVFSEEIFIIKPREFDRKLYETAVMLSILSGRAIKTANGQVELYYIKGGCAGVSYAAKNCIDRPVQLNIDFEDGSGEMISHKGTLKSAELLEPGEIKLLHHICPKGEESNLTSDWDCVDAMSKGQQPMIRTPSSTVRESQESTTRSSKANEGKKKSHSPVGVSCKCTVS